MAERAPSPETLIARHIRRHPHKPGRTEAVLRDYPVSVWALAGYFQVNGRDGIKDAIDGFRISRQAAEAAYAYYLKHQLHFDARLEDQLLIAT